MKCPISGRRREGFTLIEVTLVVTLLALLVMILYGAFQVAHRAVEKAEARSEKGQRLRALEDLLGVYIRSAYPYRVSPQDPALFFSGAPDQLTFVSALSSGMGGRGMSVVTLSWDAAEGSLTLGEEVPVRLEREENAGGYRNSLTLPQRVRAFRIEYLDARSQSERWVEEWDGKLSRTLPRAARIHFEGEQGEEVQWVFPIMMSVLAP